MTTFAAVFATVLRLHNQKPKRMNRSYRPLKQRWTLVRKAIIACITSLSLCCCDYQRGPSEADLSAFGKYVYDLDTTRMENAFRQLLDADTSNWLSASTVRHRYASVSPLVKAPLWFTRMGVSEEADSMLFFLRRQVPSNGLDTTAFFVPQIASDLFVVRKLAFDSLGLDINEVVTRLDYHLSKAYVRLTTGLRYGFIRPEKVLNRLEFREERGYLRLFDYEVKPPNYHEALDALMSDNRMEYLQQSLPQSDVYKRLQEQLALTTDASTRHTLAVNLERCRWQMPQPEVNRRQVIVNLPAQHLWAICPDTIIDMRICCGAVATKTPLLHSAITHFQVNPAWIIPQNIIKSDIVHHAGDASYFSRNRYYIINRSTGDTLNASSVTAEQLTSGRLRISQQGGARNSLGRIIFRFPNEFAVFLHDTSNRGAFQRDRRTLSHGCVRVEKPFELARFLLPEADEWTLDRLRISMDMPPMFEEGRTYLEEHADEPGPHRLLSYHGVKPNVPVFIIYFTAYPDPLTGVVTCYPDIYGYDQAIANEIPFLL